MGRRKTGGAFDELFEITALLPWWVGVALAMLTYVLLHWYASLPVQLPSAPGEAASMASSMVLKGLALGGQYLLPMILLAGALASAVGRARRKALFGDVMAGKSAGVLHDLSWQEFEMLVAEAFRIEGYAVHERGLGGPDGGVDLVLRKGGEKTLVQCKQWRAFKVGVDTVRELYGVMAAEGAAAGIVVTSGRFTEDALDFAKGRNLRLIDGENLFALIQPARRAAKGRVPLMTNEPSLAGADPTCPKCGSSMTRRTARQGAHAGKKFWGCVAFPKCTGVRQIG